MHNWIIELKSQALALSLNDAIEALREVRNYVPVHLHSNLRFYGYPVSELFAC